MHQLAHQLTHYVNSMADPGSIASSILSGPPCYVRPHGPESPPRCGYGPYFEQCSVLYSNFISFLFYISPDSWKLWGFLLLKGEVFGGGLCGEVWQRCCAGCCAGCCECGGKVWQRCCAVVLRMVVCRLVFRLRWRGLAKVLCRVLCRPAVRLLLKVRWRSLAEVLCCPGCCTGCGWLLFAAAAKSGKRAVQRAAGWRGLAKATQQACWLREGAVHRNFQRCCRGTKSGMVLCCAGCCPEKSGKGAVQGAVQAAGQSVVARGTVQGCWVQGAGQCGGELWERAAV